MTPAEEPAPIHTIRVLDIETTGIDPKADQIIEVGAFDLVLPGLIRPVGGCLVLPSIPIPPEASAVHHITGADFDEETPRLRDVADFYWSQEPGMAFAAHNADFEASFSPFPDIPWICTYKCALILWPDAPGHGNQTLRYWLGLDRESDFDPEKAMPPHRAAPDAYVTSRILRRLLAERTAEELLSYSRWPALLTKMNFGKHKGTLFRDARSDYLEWIRDKSELDANTKFTARYWLNKRAKEADKARTSTPEGATT